MEFISDLSKDEILQLIERAKNLKMRDERNLKCENKIFGLLFFEPSTRTCLSFESAIYRMGGKIIKYNKDYSSEKKGETLEDTIRTIDNYVDIFIIRHPEKNIISKIKKYTNKKIINAGDGDGEHPTQALLDLFTIMENFNKIPENIGFVGDIKYSRTIHSLVYLLSLLNFNQNYHFICNEKLTPQGKFLKYLKDNNIVYFIYDTPSSIINNLDILYITRLQKERFNNEIINPIIIDQKIIKNSKETLIIMHPLPRNEELSTELDNDNKSKYFEQVKNGVYIRMAIIEKIL